MVMKENSDLMFDEVVTRYLARPTVHGNERSETVRAYAERMRKRWGSRRMSEIHWTLEIEDLVDELRVDGDSFAAGRRRKLSAAAINIYLTSLSSMFTLATEKLGFPLALPSIKKLKERERETFLTPEQVREFCDHLDPYRRTLFKFAFHTGLRNTNVRELRWDQVEVTWNSKDAFLEFRSGEQKNGRPFSLPLNHFAFDIIKSQRELVDTIDAENGIEIPWVFPFFDENRKWDRQDPVSRWRPMSRSVLTRGSFRQAREKLGMEVVFHTARHAFATHHVRSRTPLLDLKNLGNWSSVASVERYAHTDNERKKELMKNAAVNV